MKFEFKVALSTASFLIVLGAGSIASALHRVGPPRELRLAPAHQLIIPVDGIGVDALADTWGAARAGGRHHEGIDIPAPKGTSVRATAAGTIAKLFKSSRGGITVYQFDPSGRLVFYYAHLDGYAAGLKAGDAVRQGQLLGYVGATGNATTPHLHFEIQHANAKKQWWRGKAFNPYFALEAGAAE